MAERNTAKTKRSDTGKAAPKAKPAPAAPQGPPGVQIKTPQTVLGGGEEVEITFSAPMVAGVVGVPAGCLALVLVSLVTAPPDAAQRAMLAALRRPGPPAQGDGRHGPPSAL